MKSSLLVSWALLFLAPALLLLEYFSKLWSFEEYRYFPLVFVALGWLIADRWDRKLSHPSGWLGWVLTASSCFMVALAIYLWSPWLALIGWILALGAWLWSHRDEVSNERLIGLWVCSWLLVRLPLNLDGQLTAVLQRQTSSLASFVLDWIQIPHLRNGNVFELLGGPLFVENACSGVQSVFALLFVATLVLVWYGRSIWLWPLYLVAGFFWAGVLNTVRVAIIAVAQERYQIDLAHGWRHSVLGYICLGLAILMLLSTDRLLRVLFYELPRDSVDTKRRNPLVNLWNWALATAEQPANFRMRKPASRPGSEPLLEKLFPVVGGLGLVFLVSQVALRPATTVVTTAENKVAAIWEPDSQLMDPLKEQFTARNRTVARGSDDITLGSNSDSWELTVKGLPARLAISQPYNEFHELTVCYEAIGWTLNDRRVVADYGDWNYVKATFQKESGEQATLLYSGITRSGRSINPVDSSLQLLLSGRWKSLFSGKNAPVEYKNIMIQIWLPADEPLASDRMLALIDAHVQSRKLVQEALSRNPGP